MYDVGRFYELGMGGFFGFFGGCERLYCEEKVVMLLGYDRSLLLI